jgi:hypothetical protein
LQALTHADESLKESFVADQHHGRIGEEPHGAVELQLLQDGYTLKGTNSLGALQIVLPDGSGGGLYRERFRAGGALLILAAAPPDALPFS